MSNLIPPLLSSSPPPIVGPLDEDDDDEFGDFRAATDTYVDDLSLPPSPHKSPEKELKSDLTKVNLDINCNNSQKSEMPTENLNGSIYVEEIQKDFQDRRKSDDIEPFEVNFSSSETEEVTDKESSESDKNHDQNLTEVASSISNLDQSKVNDEPISNSLENDENAFDQFSESILERTSDELSELNEINEIKSENDFTEEIQDEITDGENVKEDSIKDDLTESQSISIRVCETDPKGSDDEFGDFANFGTEKPDSEPEFDDFVEPPNVEGTEPTEDDFGDFESSDFAGFTSHSSEQPTLLEIDEKNAKEKSEIILSEIFPKSEAEFEEYSYKDETKESTIFDELKDVTETNALIYQWSKSHSQKMFFKALNIDTRNILYGPGWNGSMPRFAANLGLAPLEPIKPEILTPTPVQQASSPSMSSHKNGSDIPTAQFDWSGSGLINPLDYSQTMLLDLEQLVASLDIPSTNSNPNQSPTPSNELLDEWDLWLQPTSSEFQGNVPEDSQSQIRTEFVAPTPKLESIPSLFDNEVCEKTETENTELPKPANEQSEFSSPKFIPLRETHISTDLNDLSKPGWLQPTILTPDLPRKETVIDQEDDDEFDDFQMVLPEEKPKANTLTLEDLSEFDIQKPEQPIHNQEHIFAIPETSGPKTPPVNDDDEFTEFHSSLPQEILKPLQPVSVEPLKPTVQYSVPVTQINWPDPGVSDDDIRNIELTYSRTLEEKSQEPAKNDDDEWTDFVSVTSPVKTERTATPDLPLSVLNLSSVQAPKQPIPVITPSGLVQTKLASNLTLQPKSVVQTSIQPNLYRPPTTQVQPSLISSQFAANFFTAAPSMKPQMTGSLSTNQDDDDDDWSDFVSGQPPPPQVNGYQKAAKPTNWANATTNIIMNPTHFDSFQSYTTPQKKVQPSRHPIPSISAIPDLDFIAPKNRTSKK